MNRYASALFFALACWCGTVAAQDIRSFEPDSFGEITAQRAGKPFIVMVWSLDCAYCLDSFHALEQARRKWKVDVVTIATDRADDAETRASIRKKLKDGALQSQVWAFGSAPVEQLRYRIDPKWRGELPRSYWFDAQGRSVAYSGEITLELARKHLGASVSGKHQAAR